MINPTDKDIGRPVIYQANYPGSEIEDGIITSFNDFYVFVLFARQRGGQFGQATRRENLEWFNGTERIMK